MLLKFESIAALAFLIVEFYVLSLSTQLNIERGVRDIFDNPNCNSSIQNRCDSCDGFNAECVDSTCKRCRCSSTNATFRPSNDKNGGCVKDRYLLFILASSNSFLVERIGLKCIAPEWNNKLRTYYYSKKITCNVTDSNQRWIWTPNNQLMHVNTLKCLQKGFYWFTENSGEIYYRLVLGECISTQTKELWQCLGQNIVNFRSKTSKLYMYQGHEVLYIYGANRDTYNKRLKWNRWPCKQSLCLKAFGCYEFLGSSILVTDIRNCPRQCDAEKEIAVRHEVGENFCFVIWEKLQYLDNNEWKILHFRDKIFNVHKKNNSTFLQLNFTKATNNWTGLIVKLNFYCTRRKLTPVTTNIKCIVIKFNGIALGPPAVPPTLKEHAKNDTWDVTDIIVCVVIVILILCGVLGFIFYKRRRRSVTTTAGSREDSSAVTQPSGGIRQNPVYSTGNTNLHPFFSGKEATYQEPQTGASQECELYESTCENNVYECTDVEQNGKRPLQLQHTYDYAKNDDVRPVAQRLPAVTSPVESKQGEDCDQSSVYQMLEET